MRLTGMTISLLLNGDQPEGLAWLVIYLGTNITPITDDLTQLKWAQLKS